MAKEFHVKKRRPVRRKHIAPLLKELEEGLDIDLAVDGAEGSQSGSREPVVLDAPQEPEEESPLRRKSSRKKCPNPKYNDFVLD